MEYTLLSSDQKNASYGLNDDGTIKITGVRVQIAIVGAPLDKFIQWDSPLFSLPGGTPANEIPVLIDGLVIKYVNDTYPNT